MKLRRLLCALVSCLLLAGLTPAASAAERMTAAVVTGPVVLNGCAVDNGTAQYPLLLYSNITYFPMTYHLCRFLGLETNWDNDTRTLSITQTGERGPYVPDTGYPRKSGKAAVTRADYPVEINGVYIDNSEAAYPLFNYGGVTYFPLTFDYAFRAFGWTYQWDVENGLRIDSSTAKALPDTAVNTGNERLDGILELVNAFYKESRAYAGELKDKRTGAAETFTAQTRVSDELDFFRVHLTAAPFVFHSQLNGLDAGYLDRDLTALEPQMVISGVPSAPLPTQDPDGPYTGPYRDPDSVKEETVYLGWCFATCQFAGQRARMVRANEAVFSNPGEEPTVVTVPVDFTYEGFSSYQLTITCNSRYGDMISLAFETENYVMTMSASVM
ncbi:MAG: hypothetical protein K2P26_08540 [Oscillospiraceae bacterium]|nr:hypothetical protein [Oscillospiraceae bacterium]